MAAMCNGWARLPLRALTFAPFSKHILTMSRYPPSTAAWSAVSPSLFRSSSMSYIFCVFSACSNNSFTASRFPSVQAKWIGVIFSMSFARGSAPASSKASIISAFPSVAAQWRAVLPLVSTACPWTNQNNVVTQMTRRWDRILYLYSHRSVCIQLL